MSQSTLTNEPIESADFEFSALKAAQNYRVALLRTFANHLHGRVLEVGAGIGQLSELLLQLPAISELVSIEPEPRYCDHLRVSLPQLSLVCGTVDDLPARKDWNAILSVNVLEHIRDDERELSSYHDLLAEKNGVLCLFVPARPEVCAPLDRDFGHFRRYTRPMLQRQLERAGFQVLNLHYYNLPGYFAWWFNFCLLKKRRFDRNAISFFDRIIFPPFHAFESRVVRPPIGQSLFAVARSS